MDSNERKNLRALGKRIAEGMNDSQDFSVMTVVDQQAPLPDAAAELISGIQSAIEEQAKSPLSSQAQSIDFLASEEFPKFRDFEIGREIGRGGMGVVYEAFQTSLQRRVALKILPNHAKANRKAVARFKAEAQAAAKLNHENIVKVFEVGVEGTTFFYAMDFIEGLDLNAIIRSAATLYLAANASSAIEDGKCSPPDAIASTIFSDRQTTSKDLAANRTTGGTISSRLADNTVKDRSESKNRNGSQAHTSDYRNYCRRVAKLMSDVGMALHYAHGKGVIHRDIKPANLLLDESGRVWVTDFGLAKMEDSDLTRTGDIVGTVRYMSPERFRGHCDRTADVYSMGLTLYELLAMRPAFTAIDRAGLIERIHNTNPTPLRKVDARISLDLETIVGKAIAKEPYRRYATAEDFAEDLNRYLNNQPILARQVGTAERVVLWAGKNTAVATLVSTMAFLLVAVAIGSAIAAFNYRTIALAEQEASKRATQSAEKAELEADIANSINQFFNSDILGMSDVQRNVNDLSLREVLTTAAATVGERFQDSPIVEAEIRRTIGRALAGLGKFEEGIAQLQASEELLKTELDESDPKYMRTISELGRAYRDWEKPDIAEPYLQRYLVHCKQRHGDESRETMQARHMLGMTLNDLNRIDEAEEILLEVLQWRKENLGDRDPDTIRTILAISGLYLYEERLETAEPYILSGAALSVEVLGQDNYATMLAIQNLGQFYVSSGKFAEAEPVLMQSLQLTESLFDSNHPACITAIGALAELYEQTDRMDEAIEQRNEQVARNSVTFGPFSETTINSRLFLQSDHRAKEQYDQAAAILQNIRAAIPDTLPVDHWMHAVVESELASIEFSKGNYTAALKIYQATYEGSVQRLGENDRRTITALSQVCNAAWMSEDYETARDGWRKVLDHALELGDTITATLALSRQVAMAELKLGDSEAAKATILRAMPMFDDIQDNAVDMIENKYRMLLDLCNCHLQAKEYSLAESRAREVTAFQGWREGKKYRHFRAQAYLGGALLGQGKWDDAEMELLAAYEGLNVEKAKPVDIAQVSKYLAELYKALGDEDESESWRAKFDEFSAQL